MNLDNIDFRAIQNRFNEAEEALVRLDDLTVRAAYQMRTQMDLDNIEKLRPLVGRLDPIHIAEINGEFYILDGFHRCFAHQEEGAEEIKRQDHRVGRGHRP